MPDLSGRVGFPPFELDAEHAMVYRGCDPVEIHATPMRLLIYLAQSRNRIVPRSELLAHVWRDSVVSETVVSSALNELRRALDDDGASQKLIRTERGRGYQFIGESPTGSFTPQLKHSPEPSKLISIAVLPFIDMGAHRDRGYVTNGLTEEITNELVHLNGIRVAARTSSFAFKKMVLDVREIGAMMNVEAVIEGSIRSQADGLRICAQLVRTSDGFYLWSDTFERNANNIIGVEIEIAKFVAVVLREEIAGAQKK